MTVGELSQRMASLELSEWIAIYRLEAKPGDSGSLSQRILHFFKNRSAKE